MKNIIKLMRVHHWVKNSFMFLPLFFAGEFFQFQKLFELIIGTIAFGFIASSIYIINDYRDIEDDKKHPEKCKRPLASGAVSKQMGIIVFFVLVILGFSISYYMSVGFAFILAIYFLLNLGYSFGLKEISILDVIIVAVGFNLRVKAGGSIADVHVSVWLTLLVFLLALFLAFAKRRDDILLKIASGKEMRKSIKGYNLEFLTTAMTLICSVAFVAYIMYTLSPYTIERMGTYRLYYTSLFVLAGILRYLQIAYVYNDSGSPTKILYKDRFVQISIVLWIFSFAFLLYFKDITFFTK